MDEEAWFQDVTDSIEVGKSLFQASLPPLPKGSSFYQYSISFSPVFLVMEEDDPVLQQKAVDAQVHISITSKPSNVLGEHDISFRDVVFLGEARLKLLIQLIDNLKNDSLTLTDFINGVFLLTQNRMCDDKPDGLLAFPSGAESFIAPNRVELHSHSAYTSLRRSRKVHTLLRERLNQSDETHKNAQLVINQVLAEHEYIHTETKLIQHQEPGKIPSVVQSIQSSILPIYLQGSKSARQQGRIAPGMRIVIDVVKTNLELVKSLIDSTYVNEAQNFVTKSDQTDITDYTGSRISLPTSGGGLKLGEEVPLVDSFFEPIFSHHEKIQAQEAAMFTLTSLLSIYFLVMLSLQRNIRAGVATNRFYDFLALVTQEECDVRPWLHVYKALRLFPLQPGNAVSAWLSSTASIPITLRDLREEILQQIERIYGLGTTNTLSEFVRLVQQRPETIEQQMIIEHYQNTDCLSFAKTSSDNVTIGIRQPSTIEAQLGLESRMVAALQSFYVLLKDPFDERTGLIDPFSINGYLKATKSVYLKDFVELYRLGKGGYGEVVCANRLMENQKYAVKKVVIDRRDFHAKTESAGGFLQYIKSIMNEVRILSRLLHPFIVKYYYSWIETTSDTFQNATEAPNSSMISSGCTTGTGDDSLEGSLATMTRALDSPSSTPFSTPKTNKSAERREIEKVIVFVQMEYCSHGCLSDFIQKCSDGTPLCPSLAQGLTLTELLWRMTAQLASAVAYIHSKDIIHYDIKPANVFLDESYNIKLGDFGTSYTCKGPNDNQDLFASDRSTLFYMAPELSAQHWMQSSLNDAAQSNLSVTALRKQADMYSLGITLLELWFLPTNSDSLSNLHVLVQNKQLPSEFTETHPNVSAILYQLCDIHPLKRLTASALIEALSALNLPVISSVFRGVPYTLSCSPESRLSDTLNLLKHSEDGISREDRHALMNLLIKDSYCAELSLLSLEEFRDTQAKLSSPTLLAHSLDCCKSEAKNICKQGILSTRKKYTILEFANKPIQESFDVCLETSWMEGFIEHILLLMGTVPITLPSTVSYASLRPDAQQYASLSGCNVFLTARLTQQLLVSMSIAYQHQQSQKQNSSGLLNQESIDDLHISVTASRSASEMLKPLSITTSATQEYTAAEEDISARDSSSLLLLDLTRSAALAFQVFLLSSVSEPSVHYLAQNSRPNTHDNGTTPSIGTQCYLARYLHSDGEQCIGAFRRVLSIATVQNTNLVAISRIRALEWALTIFRVLFETINQHIIHTTVQKRTAERKLKRLADILSIDITIRFVKGAPLNQEQFKLAGERPNIFKVHNLSHIDNIVFFQSLETINSCGIISTTVLLLEYLKTSVFVDRIRIRFISAEGYSFGSNSISFACYIRDLWHVQPRSSNLTKNNRTDDSHSRRRAFVYTTVDGVTCDVPSAETEMTDQQKNNIGILLTGAFLVTNSAEHNEDKASSLQPVPYDFVSLRFSPRAIQETIRQYANRSRTYPIVRHCNPMGLVAQICASYGEDILLEEKLAILTKTIFIQQTFLSLGFHIIPEFNENNNLVQSNCINVVVNKTQFEFHWGGAKRVHHIVDCSLCPEANMVDSIGRFLSSLEEHLISDMHL
ncbi:Kinase, PEK [Giardia lamblia P15]|uniref:Kinase, PEK n=1 Tax=Giardia intestinalis (strain P15) TaxID=658858 RepID=E1F155_GIAIA|nr:Kinase, PEK [Giardia lamblia P15]